MNYSAGIVENTTGVKWAFLDIFTCIEIGCFAFLHSDLALNIDYSLSLNSLLIFIFIYPCECYLVIRRATEKLIPEHLGTKHK
jgi:hypothetical protein